MRSEFFNQIKKNRENYYREYGRQYHKPKEPTIETSVFKLSVPRFSNFTVPQMQFPDLTGFKKIGGQIIISMANSLAVLWKKARLVCGRGGRFIQARMNKLQAKYESKTEALQEKFYDRVVVLFEDDPGELLNQKRQREPEKTKMEGFANNLAPRLRQLLTKILISLELDDAGNELRPVPERTNEAGNAPRKAIIRKAKSPRFMAGELVTQLNKLFFKHSRRSLQPIINRFIL